MRHRIVFPILDQVGRPIAFGGRKMREEDEPKYLNSPETALFDKSSTLYGMHAAARAIQKEGSAVIVEGYMDVIACHQAGVKHAVGTLGTALTPKHAGALKRLCSVVTLVFDSDEAGQRAADRAVEVFFAEPVDVRIAVLPGAKDPAELLEQEGGRGVFDAAVAGAVDALDYRYARLAERLAGAGVSARAAAVETDVARLVEMGLARVAPIRRRMIVQRLARVLGIEESPVLEAIARAAGERDRRGPARRERAAAVGAGRPTLSAAEHAMGCLLAEPALWPGLGAGERAMLAPELLEGDDAREVARVLLARLESGHEASLGQVVAAMEGAGARERATAAAFEAEHICRGDQGLLDRRLRECLVQARRNRERRGSTLAGDAPSMSAAGVGGSDLLSEVKPANESEASSRGADDEGVSRLEARFAQRRKSIELTG
jgi:DNA primase